MQEKYILIVEPAASFRDTFSHFLGKEYIVFQAENGRSALNILENNTIDLVITGLDMPVMNGLELLRAIKSSNSMEKIPVLIVASFDEPEIEVHALELGAIDVLAKPFPREVALRRVENILSLSQASPAPIHKLDPALLETQRANLLLQTVMDEASAGIVMYEFSMVGKSKVLLFNDRLAAILGYGKKELGDILAKSHTDSLHPEDAPAIIAKIQHSLKNGLNFSVVCRTLHKNGSYILLSIAATVIQKDSHSLVFYLSCTGSEITNLKDSLTGLYSREAIAQFSGEVLLRSGSAMGTLFILNVDNFNGLNENFGRDFGDKVLMEIADKLRKIFRSQDLISRTGGDEFCVFLSNDISTSLIEIRAQQIISAIFRQYSNWRCNVEISASVGVALAPTNGSNFEGLYTTAKLAMIKVKKSGKNNFSIA